MNSCCIWHLGVFIRHTDELSRSFTTGKTHSCSVISVLPPANSLSAKCTRGKLGHSNRSKVLSKCSLCISGVHTSKNRIYNLDVPINTHKRNFKRQDWFSSQWVHKHKIYTFSYNFKIQLSLTEYLVCFVLGKSFIFYHMLRCKV